MTILYIVFFLKSSDKKNRYNPTPKDTTMTTIETITTGFSGRQRSGSTDFTLLSSLWAGFLRHRQLRHTRLDLFELTEDQLRDIGITREAAEREAARSTIAHYMHNGR
jgi:uncharacterized protein YjiS (DUF1127 family)